MSRKCELTGVGVLYGNNVSHSQRKTRRRFEPNLRSVKFTSDITAGEYRLSVNARCISSVEKAGGFDAYILKADDNVLSGNARAIKKKIIQTKTAKSL
ncbi:50S ribosomal protein L28 [Rickettsia rickettsii]|uniref:Large ribosomal subunit protein bL28 n=2 Tax=Rickettsia rickettsii TaxID=783 RepID=RL28_RICRO|nr:50S ribosomal protein L28 [Rickettsia rickettsii]A8GQR9.1 RecName: Full=Large ribosomal subunit protein bL28; AltName: Full=50S ribosomal protein L28 [Rickettsia rickettsii str. 'Sheila Smith']B0BW65.1 RecName: Full=Large ribosomal subunit protein bL28; AltName: Full=50S ribosomal protein L28 [Rickettsia rickettsii str. Iowa]ABV75744.1 50S ribosomal protein L28 [Rickettsia rickettsii str. 'Sheila Smith']ABY72091.1 LSU ribosomal protein L28P [Rickettsia rickettsii str. Iowa]AFB22692.1 50S ri